jgi:hypothetical protein
MVPSNLTNFFLASSDAGGALIGLLFVAVSIDPEKISSTHASLDRQAVAASAFTALVNAFFISLGGLIPGNLGWIALIMSILGVLNSLSLGKQIIHKSSDRVNFFRRFLLLFLSMVIYLAEFYFAFQLVLHPHAYVNAYTLAGFLIGVYAIGLVRAWELLGVKRFGFLSWLNPLKEMKKEN